MTKQHAKPIPITSAAEMLGAISDPTRLRLLSLILHNGEICVCDLMEITELPQTKISKHLAILRHAGLVKHRREGTWMHYSMLPAGSQLQQSIVETVREAHLTVPELKADLKRLKNSSCCTPQIVRIKI